MAEEDPDDYDVAVRRWNPEELRYINAPARPFEVTWLRFKIRARELRATIRRKINYLM